MDRMRRVAVVGAAGKMGRGIAQLVLEEMTFEALKTGNSPRLILIDSNQDALDTLKPLLRRQLRRTAEKQISRLRELFAENPSLVSNTEMIELFLNRACELTNVSNSADGAVLVFEAAAEDVAIKTALFRTLKTQCDPECLFLTNTSSIPIKELSKKAGLEERLVGFHFYNPPPVQKLLEIVIPEGVDHNIEDEALALASRLRKTVVRSADRAGFIGNGHFIRELREACLLAEKISHEQGLFLHEAIALVNCLTRDFLIRPMGIFELADFIGLDICSHIASIMERYLGTDELHHPLVDNLAKEGSGALFFKNKKEEDNETWQQLLKRPPTRALSWKAMRLSADREQALNLYFQTLLASEDFGCRLAKQYLLRSREIALELVETQVAKSLSDVSIVLTLGFQHLYGPDAAWLEEYCDVE